MTIEKEIFKNLNTKTIDSKENNYFYEDLQPQILPPNFDMAFSGIIKGRIVPYKFMNSLCDIIDKTFKDNCYIKISGNELKFNVIFEKEENIDEIEIKIKLYKSNYEEFILKFTNINGSFQNFSSKFQSISELITRNNN